MHRASLHQEILTRHPAAPVVLTAMSWMIIAGCSASAITISESGIRAVFTPGTSIRLLWDTTSRPVTVGATGGPNTYDFSALDFHQYDSVSTLAVTHYLTREGPVALIDTDQSQPDTGVIKRGYVIHFSPQTANRNTRR